ncbi:MAG: tetratricopeptide repeat protein [Bacteroidales bacterium]|nr:tetratricopeptide repeat protein [Bacteroidales bacterium]
MEHTKSIIGSLLLGFFLLFCNYLSANNLNQVMQQANEAYQQKDYATSIDLYQQIVEAGNEGAILYYNLGNAYFKNDELAKAVLWYERARRLDPRNEDIQHNIAFVNQKLIDKIDVLPELFITRWWKGVSQSFTSNGWAIASIIFSALFFLFLALFLLLKNPRIKSLSIILSIICIVLLIFSILFAHQEKNRYEKHPEAIVMDLE